MNPASSSAGAPSVAHAEQDLGGDESQHGRAHCSRGVASQRARAEVSRRSGWAGMVMVPPVWPGLAVDSTVHTQANCP